MLDDDLIEYERRVNHAQELLYRIVAEAEGLSQERCAEITQKLNHIHREFRSVFYPGKAIVAP